MEYQGWISNKMKNDLLNNQPHWIVQGEKQRASKAHKISAIRGRKNPKKRRYKRKTAFNSVNKNSGV